MSCGGCTDCDPTAFHIHVTVAKNSMFKEICGLLKLKPIEISNVIFGAENHLNQSYEEQIATETFRSSSLLAATERMEEITDLLKRLGLDVVREKIEGPPWINAGEFRYAEAHIKIRESQAWNWGRALRLPMSLNVNRDRLRSDAILTVRSQPDESMDVYIARLKEVIGTVSSWESDAPALPPIEFAFVDTNPDLDTNWMKQWAN